MTGTDSYETHVVFGRMGSNSTTSASGTYDRLYSWSVFDGQYFKTHSFKAYVSNATSNKMTIGNIKHLVGNFSGAMIAWTTNTTTTIYVYSINEGRFGITCIEEKSFDIIVSETPVLPSFSYLNGNYCETFSLPTLPIGNYTINYYNNFSSSSFASSRIFIIKTLWYNLSVFFI